MGKHPGGFRNYEAEERPTVREFYRLNHRHQTLDFVKQKKAQYLTLDRRKMSVWGALEYLNTLVDDSDPDLDLTQIDHALQTAESIRHARQPRWFIVTGLVHDLGKILCLWGEPQWAVVGDTFPVGCAFSDKIVYPEFFDDNPDRRNPAYASTLGIYDPHCGLENVHMSWGHDEYLYHVVKDRVPEEARYMIRYHSFYAAHREGEYDHLMNERDHEMFRWVRAFNRYDLYSKGDGKPNAAELRPYYEDLVAEFFPEPLNF
jgi:inositol oxygenase